MRNRSVYLTALLLVSVTAAIIAFKTIYGGQKIDFASRQNRWRISVEMSAIGKGERAKIRLTLPKDTNHQVIYNENFDHDEEANFYTRERPITGNRIGFWRYSLLDDVKSIRYGFSAQLKRIEYVIPALASVPKNPHEAYPEELHIWLDPSEFIQSEDPGIKKKLKRISGKSKNTLEIMSRLYDFMTTQVIYKSEKGSKDASETLDKLVADCGGQARLLAALSRAAGIPSRIVGGIILDTGVKKITHVWVENYIEGTWIPFDVVNKHFAVIPANYLVLYRGDYFLFKHTGLSKFDYYFVIDRDRIPPVDQSWSLYSLPYKFQNLVKILLLIPLGALVVAFFRIVIGINTFGTFTPVILAIAFRDASIWTALGCMTIMLLIGWAVRSLLDRFKILVIPRISVIVTLVVIMTLCIMMLGHYLGFDRVLYISFFPMIIITWMIERFSVLQIEDGTFSAFKAVAGTFIVAFVAYRLMEINIVKEHLFTFPELLLTIVALQLIIGRYTGLRLTELWRFREYLKLHQRSQT